MGMTSPFPEPDSPELAPYVVRSRVEIVSALRRLRDQRVAVTIFHGDDGRFAVANVLDVHAGADELILECGADLAVCGDVAAAARLTVVGFLENVKLQFSSTAAELLVASGSMFRLQLPRQMLRLQRRAFLRIKARAVVCHVPRAPGSMHYYALRVVDLGIGGCALRVDGGEPEFVADQLIERCQLELNDDARLDVSLRVRHCDAAGRDGSGLRVGCEFVGLDASSQHLLQQYVDQTHIPLRAAERRRSG